MPLLVAQSGRSLQPLLQQLCNSVTKWPWAALVVASCWGAHPASTGLDAGQSMKLLDEGVEKLIDYFSLQLRAVWQIAMEIKRDGAGV